MLVFETYCTRDFIEQIKINTRRLAKLQRTWLKRFVNVHWIAADDTTSIPQIAQPILAELNRAAADQGGSPASSVQVCNQMPDQFTKE